MKAKDAVLVISGYNTRAVIAFCRWADSRHVPFHIIACGDNDSIFLTKYRAQVAFTRRSQELGPELFIEWSKVLLQEHGYKQIFVLPSSEYLNRFLLTNREILEAAGCQVPLIDESLYLQVSDKYSFAKLCALHNLDVPKEFETLPTDLPFVAKPRRYLSKAGRRLVPHLVDSSSDLERFLHEEEIEDFFFQENVTGRSLYLFACIRTSGDKVLFSQENLIQQARGGSIVLAKRSEFHKTRIAQQYVTMLGSLRFTGLIMIEIRYNLESGRYFMIEANPRPWGPIQLAVDNGFDFFGPHLSDKGFELTNTSPTPSPGDPFYFWSGGITTISSPLRFHNYSQDLFIRDLPHLWKHDIYFRNDTLDIYLHEHLTAPLREC